jgi:ABC-type sugar transport system ATPase subunit
MNVQLVHLSKTFGSVLAVDDVNLRIRNGELLAVLGPSGCGKSTLLAMIAGTCVPSAGLVHFGRWVVNDLPPRERNLGMVFHGYALYPHMSVLENISFPIRFTKLPRNQKQQRAQRAAEMLGIEALLDLQPSELSDEQQLRVALARVMAKEPDLLLFDEPLSNLEDPLRLSMRREIRRLQVESGITAIYATHDQAEAMTVADRIAVMKEGRLQTCASPEDLYNRPHSRFVASIVGDLPMSFIEVEVVCINGAYHVLHPAFDLRVPSGHGEKAADRGVITMGVRPEDVEIAVGGIPGDVCGVEPQGRDDLLDVCLGETNIRALVDHAMGFEVGDRVHLDINTAKAQFFDPQSQRSLLWTDAPRGGVVH